MKYDVVIVGAGPAGLKAAEVLAKNKKKVLVLEKNKIIGPKCCAGGIANRDFEYINRELIEHSFNSLIFHSKFQKRELKSKDNFIYTINRKRLGQYQNELAQKAGAEIITNAEIKEINKKFIKKGKEKIFFDFLIGADGSNSIVRKFLKLKSELTIAMHYIVKKEFNNIEVFFDYDLFGVGYSWIFPNKGFSSIGCGAIMNSVKASELKKNFDYWLKTKDIDLKDAMFKACPLIYSYNGYEFGNIFLVGDAAGLASPLTGEGIYQALLSGEEVAKKILDKNYVCARLNQLIEMNARRRKRIEELLKKSKTYMKTNLEIGTFLLRFPHFQKRLLKRILR